MYFLPLNQTTFSMGQKNASLKRYYQKTKPKLKIIKKTLKKNQKKSHFSTKITIFLHLCIYFSMYFFSLNETPFRTGQKMRSESVV